MKIAGLDIGTTGCKCTVFDEKGNYLGKAYKDYPIKRQTLGHEIDMSSLKESVIEVVTEMAAQYPDIAGLGVTSFGETFVLTDEDGVPLDVAMLYTDPRGSEECCELIDRLGEKTIAHITGVRPHEMYTISKLMWVKKHKSEIYNAAKHVFLVEDFIVFVFSKITQIDYSLATRTMAFDIERLDWSKEIFEAAGIDASMLSKPVPTGSAAGRITEEMAEITGLNKDTVIVSISHDQVAAAVGSGAFSSALAVDGAGTVECMIPIYDRLPNIDKMYEGYFVTVPYVLTGKYVTYAFQYTGGALVQWCIDNIARQEKSLAKEMGISVNEFLERDYARRMMERGKAADEPSGLLILPHFAGAATPYMDTGSKGVIVGLTTDTSASEIYMACLEGVCYEMYLIYKKLRDTGINYRSFNATGGGAKSAVWMQMKADILGVPFTALKTVDAGTVGSAMLTGIAIGIFSDLQDAAAHMVEETITYEPRKSQHDRYMEIYERYEKLYDAVRPLVV